MKIALCLLPEDDERTGNAAYSQTLREALTSQALHPVSLIAPTGARTPKVAEPHAVIPYAHRRRAVSRWSGFDFNTEVRAATLLRRMQPDVVIGNAQWALPRRLRCPLVAIVYELELLQEHPWGLYSPSMLRQSSRHLAQNIKAASTVIAISETVAHAVVQRFGIPEGRVFLSPPALRPFPPYSGPELTSSTHPYVAAVGWFHPRKDLPLALDAWMEYRRRGGDHDLLLIGAEGPPDIVNGSVARRILEHTGPLSSHVHVVGSVPRAALGALLSRASALLVCSMHEGFGIPVIEAAALGTPVVAAARTSLEEVAGSISSLASPNAADLAQALLRRVAHADDPDKAMSWARGFTVDRQMQGVWQALSLATKP